MFHPRMPFWHPKTGVAYPTLAAHWTALGLLAPTYEWAEGSLTNTIGSELLTANGTTTTGNVVAGFPGHTFAGVAEAAASGFRNGNNVCGAGVSQSFAYLSYTQIPAAPAGNDRGIITAASVEWQVRMQTTGYIKSAFYDAFATGSVDHSGTGVQVYCYYRNSTALTAGTMTPLEHISNAYKSNATTNLSNHGVGSHNAGTAVAAYHTLFAIFYDAAAELIATKASLQALGFPFSW